VEQGIEKGIEKGIERGIEKGIEKGIEQGIERGMESGAEALRYTLMQVVESRFGKTPPAFPERLRRAGLAELQAMVPSCTRGSWEDLH
jgi:flagellar biosynthesis/type III secretory pathway protein FliH